MAGGLLGGVAAQAQNEAGSPPAQIITTDGRTYNQVTVLRSEPDGLVVSYQPEGPGVGLAKLKFRNLPDSLRNRYGYSEQAASDYEARQAQATAQWRSQQAAAGNAVQTYRDLAEMNRALAGDALVSYSISLDTSGKVSAQGFTGNVPPYPYYGYGNPFPVNLPQQQQQPTPGTGPTGNRPAY